MSLCTSSNGSRSRILALVTHMGRAAPCSLRLTVWPALNLTLALEQSTHLMGRVSGLVTRGRARDARTMLPYRVQSPYTAE